MISPFSLSSPQAGKEEIIRLRRTNPTSTACLHNGLFGKYGRISGARRRSPFAPGSTVRVFSYIPGTTDASGTALGCTVGS